MVSMVALQASGTVSITVGSTKLIIYNMSDTKLHKLKGKNQRNIFGDNEPFLVKKFFDRKCGSIDGKLSKMELKEKELKKPIDLD